MPSNFTKILKICPLFGQNMSPLKRKKPTCTAEPLFHCRKVWTNKMCDVSPCACDMCMGRFRYCLQGDTSGRTKPIVDMKTKVVVQYKLYKLKRNWCFNVNDRFGPTWCVSLYCSWILLMKSTEYIVHSIINYRLKIFAIINLGINLFQILMCLE